ncbi:MAG: hypothetical protein U1F65_04275 [Verrucomicrobiota bacterium]
MKTTTHKLAVTTVGLAALLGTSVRADENKNADWQDKAIAPVANPIYFEDPRIYTEVRPIFMNHWLPDNFHFSGGTVPLGARPAFMRPRSA